MCHLILLLPIIALPVFWFWPWPVALGVYAVVLVVSGWIYFYVMLAMRRPVVTGVEHTMHSGGVVIDDAPNALRVRVNSESWRAESDQPLRKGDVVTVVGHDGLTLRVQADAPPGGQTTKGTWSERPNADLPA